MFQSKVVEKIKSHILCSVTFFLKSCRYETMWKNIVEPVRSPKIWRICIICWIPKTTDTHSECVNTYRCSTAAMFARTRLIVTLCVHCLSCLSFVTEIGCTEICLFKQSRL